MGKTLFQLARKLSRYKGSSYATIDHHQADPHIELTEPGVTVTFDSVMLDGNGDRGGINTGVCTIMVVSHSGLCYASAFLSEGT